MSQAQATWVYAITGDVDCALLAGIDGISDDPVRTVTDDCLTAVVGSVDAAGFSEEAFERLLSDPGEVEAMALAHHRVIVAVAAMSPVLPLRLATVYHDDDRVCALLKERRSSFAGTLRWLAGRSEYGVKAWADPDAVSAVPAAAGPPRAQPSREPYSEEPDQPGSPASRGSTGRGAGAAYLSRRRAQLAARADGWQRAARGGADLHGALSLGVAAARQHPPQNPQLARGQGLMVLNGAYLVDDAHQDRFADRARAMLAELDLAGFRLDVTGPWPPYSFAEGPAEGPHT